MSSGRQPGNQESDAATPGERQGRVPSAEGYLPAPPVQERNSHAKPPESPPTGSEKPPTRQKSTSPRPTRQEEYHGHPLHGIYRKRIRGIRARWLGSGFVVGLVVGVLITLAASALVVTSFPEVVQTFTGEPDLTVAIGEGYLNREAAAQIKVKPIQAANLTLKSLSIDLKPDNRMDLQPTFDANLLITTIPVSAAVKNVLSVKDGKLAISMVGNPQIGNLSVPIDLLPFNLNAQIRQAVDKVNNDLLISEINQTLVSGFGSNQFAVQGVNTSDTNMTITLQHQ